MYLVLCWPSHFSVTFLAGEVLCTEDEMASFAALLCHIHHHEYDSQRYLPIHIRICTLCRICPSFDINFKQTLYVH